MSEPVKRYAMHYAEIDLRDGLYPDTTGEWCRYEPRFDAPQLNREEVDLIEWAWVNMCYLLRPDNPHRNPAGFGKPESLRQLVAQISDSSVETMLSHHKPQPQASPWVPCSERMPEQSKDDPWLLPHCWVTDGETVEQGWWDGSVWLNVAGSPMSLNVILWSPIIRPEPPNTTDQTTEKP